MNIYTDIVKDKVQAPLRSIYGREDTLHVVENFRLTGPPSPIFYIAQPVIVLVEKGDLDARLNLKPIRLKPQSMLILLPNQVLECEGSSNDLSGKLLIFSHHFAQNLHIKVDFNLLRSIRIKPVTELQTEAYLAIENFLAMVTGLFRNPDNPYLDEALVNLIRAYFYGAGYYFHLNGSLISHSRQEDITNEFLSLVETHCHRFRTIDFYAHKMHLSPKYIANAVKASSGISPSEWIASYTTFKAKSLLATTHMSVSQICDALHFPDLSTFGKYFRRQTQLSPKQFRDRLKSGI